MTLPNELWPLLEKAAPIHELIDAITTQVRPGHYQFELHPESREYRKISMELRGFPIPEVAAIGKGMQDMIRELAETDRVYRVKPETSFAARRQMRALSRATGNLIKASDRLRRLIIAESKAGG